MTAMCQKSLRIKIEEKLILIGVWNALVVPTLSPPLTIISIISHLIKIVLKLLLAENKFYCKKMWEFCNFGGQEHHSTFNSIKCYQTKVSSNPTIMDLIFPSEGWILSNSPQNSSIGNRSFFCPQNSFFKSPNTWVLHSELCSQSMHSLGKMVYFSFDSS